MIISPFFHRSPPQVTTHGNQPTKDRKGTGLRAATKTKKCPIIFPPTSILDKTSLLVLLSLLSLSIQLIANLAPNLPWKFVLIKSTNFLAVPVSSQIQVENLYQKIKEKRPTLIHIGAITE